MNGSSINHVLMKNVYVFRLKEAGKSAEVTASRPDQWR
jgi:hypothetical protein